MKLQTTTLIVQIHMHAFIHTFTFVATLVRSSALGTLLVYRLQGHGVLSTCMCCIDLHQAGINFGAKTTEQNPTTLSGIIKWGSKSVLHGLKSPALQFLKRCTSIFGFLFAANGHFIDYRSLTFGYWVVLFAVVQ